MVGGGKLRGFRLGALIGALGAVLFLTPQGAILEESLGLQALFHLRGPIPAPPEAVVVAIDQPSADALGLPAKPSDWPRSVHARLIDALSKANASVIAFDLAFNAPGRDPQDDRQLAESMRAAGNVVLVQTLKPAELHTEAGHELVQPIAQIAGAARAQAPFVLPKVARVNEYSAFRTDIRNRFEMATMPAVVLQLYGQASHDEFVWLMRGVSPTHAATLPENRAAVHAHGSIPELILDMRHLFGSEPQLAPEMLALLHSPSYQTLGARERRSIDALLKLYSGDEVYYLNFYGPPRSIRTIPYWQLLHPQAASEAFDLRGAAVFVGYSALTLAEQDQIRDDYHTVFSLPNGVYVSGVEIAATAFANLLHDHAIKPLPLWADLSVVFLWGLVISVLCRSLPNVAMIGLLALLVAAYVLFAAHQFETNSLWLALTIPMGLQLPLALFGGVYFKYRQTRRERQRLKEGASLYLPERVVEEILQNIKPEVQRQVLFGVCLATDADQYTTLAERMKHRELSELMNEYYGVMFVPVKRHGGIVSDVVGDSMLAVWAGVEPDLLLRKRACDAALDIVNALTVFNSSSGRPPLPTRLGLHSGEMLLGSIGAAQHFEYRAVGDMVNTASRIQGLNKYLDTDLILSAQTAEGLEGYLMRPLGSFLLVGKSVPIDVLELMAHAAQADESQRRLCETFREILNLYRARQWGEACAALDRILESFPHDGPSRFYRVRCADYLRTPPPESWTHVVSMNAK